MLFVNKIAVVSATLLFLLGVVAFAGDFDPSYAGSFATTSDAMFWPSFIGAALIVLSNPVLFLALLFVFPEPRAIYGPAGPRLVRAADVPVPPITSPAVPVLT